MTPGGLFPWYTAIPSPLGSSATRCAADKSGQTVATLSLVWQERIIETDSSTSNPERQHDLDWPRMFVVFGLVFFHFARIFDTLPWYVKNYPTSELFTVAMGFAALWGMPLLFVVAGMGVRYSLHSRTTKAFVVERVVPAP